MCADIYTQYPQPLQGAAARTQTTDSMPFITNTPESLLARADSKNPASTCHAITTSGRPCRRPRPANSPPHALYYCWQHQDQASPPAQTSPSRPPRPSKHQQLQHRSSLETLAERLGLVDLEDDGAVKPHAPRPSKSSNSKHRHKSRSLLVYLCADPPSSRPQPQPRPARPKPRPVQTPTSSPGGSSGASPMSRVKHLIPDDVDAATASALLAEVARPYDRSEQPGYIYMYWLTATGAPSPDAARAMLSPTNTKHHHPSSPHAAAATMSLKIGRSDNVQRRMNEWRRQCGRDVTVLRYYPYSSSHSPTSSYSSTNSRSSKSSKASSASTPAAQARMTPHAHRVEQLIKLELKGRGMKADMGICSACGREHREWFNVPASRAAVGLVDAVIRRWVKWDEATVLRP